MALEASQFPHREDVRLALDHGIGVRMHDALGLHVAYGLLGASGLGGFPSVNYRMYPT